jgi:hypothetical protein
MTSPHSHLCTRHARLGHDCMSMRELSDSDACDLPRVMSLRIELAPQKPEKTTLSEVVREFTPNWFAVTMGTGALALALNQMPLPLPGAYDIAGACGFSTCCYSCFSPFSMRRVGFFSSMARGRFFGILSSRCFSVRFPWDLPLSSTAFLFSACRSGGNRRFQWPIHSGGPTPPCRSPAAFLVPFLMFTIQGHSMERMTAIWLLSIVAAEVAAASGALLVPHLSAWEAVTVLILCYALWAFSVPLAMSILVILLLRLVLYKLPNADMAASGWLAVGPLGMGALGLLLLGGDAPAVLGVAGLSGVGEVAFSLGIIGGTILWGYGAWWLLLAILKTARYSKKGCRSTLAGGASSFRSASIRWRPSRWGAPPILASSHSWEVSSLFASRPFGS